MTKNSINSTKCHFAKLEIDWLRYHISQTGISPLQNKTSDIISIEASKSLKDLQPFPGSVFHISKFIPNVAQISHPLLPRLRKTDRFVLN